MRTSQYLLSTLKEIPIDSDIISYNLMIRAGMIRKLASGLYDWLPTGIRVLRKIENIIREEMDRSGAIEIYMPIIQPADLWKENEHLNKYSTELFSFIDRNNRSFVLGPTNEKLISDLIRNEITSYKQLPLNLYQIQTKFRDEIRPRFGVIRSREFIMKDAYSFHINQNSLQKTYDIMYKTYNTIFTRIGINFIVVKADNGSIGGNISHEFQALSDNGENNIVFSTISDYAANIELAEVTYPTNENIAIFKDINFLNIFEKNNIKELIKQHNLPIEKTVKALIVNASKESGYKFIALLIRGDHELNKIKAEKHPLISKPLKFSTKEEILTLIKVKQSVINNINLPIPAIIDRSVSIMNNFSININIDYKYYFDIDWKKIFTLYDVYDLRNVINGDPSPDGKGILQIKKGIEIGHIFQLGTKYSKIMKTYVQNKDGYNQAIEMGCYGIGITRVIAAVIEQNHDHKGIIWPDIIAPFQVAILPINMYKSYRVKEIAEKLYYDLQINNINVIFNDRKELPGVMFADMELIGIPHVIIISDQNLNDNKIEYKQRKNNKKKIIHITHIIDFLKTKLK
ncbi:MAG: proline--tRNA ligase [Arsenophonus endosymbiont of Ceratovacuna japonica]